MGIIYTIGFTKKKAEDFFGLLSDNKVDILIDVRLNNTSQLAGFSKYPDIEFFLKKICDIEYIWDKKFSPEDWLLKRYKKKEIQWAEYVKYFESMMKERDIQSYISKNYESLKTKNVCLLCSEEKADNCHRSLVAGQFGYVFNLDVVHL